jgi:hypothetical protein
MTNEFRFGFRVVGDCSNDRRLVDASTAFRGHAGCDERAELTRECYLSAFQFTADFAVHLKGTGSPKGFAGPCWSRWLWFDIDREEIERATDDARRLVAFAIDRYSLDDDDLLLFFSGSKGFHVGIPTSLWQPEPSPTFHKASRRFAAALAERAGVRVDESVYDKLRLFRAPNSRHPKTGLLKRRLEYDELMRLSAEGILRLAETPSTFDVPSPPDPNPQAAADWQQAVEAEEQAVAARRRTAGETAKLNRGTLDLIRGTDLPTAGDRHRMLFSAAANLAEWNCPPPLAHALLTDAGLDSGLTPSEVRRQIDCGLQHVGPVASESDASPPQTPPNEGRLYVPNRRGYYEQGF